MTILGKRAFGGLAAPGLGQRRTPAVANPITGTGPVLAALTDGDTLSDAVTPGSYSSTAGEIVEPVPMQMQVDGGAWVAYVGSTGVSTGEVWLVREIPGDGTNSRTFTSAQQVVQAVPLFPPINTEAPAISGTLQVGETLTVSNGTWDPAATGYNRRWLRDGTPISGATSSTYLLAEADEGHVVTAEVQGVNDDGASAWVAATGGGEVQPAPIPVPSNVTPPAISGDLIDGETLSRTLGTWSPTPDETEWRWLSDASPAGTGSTLDLTGREGEVISGEERARMTGGEWSSWEPASGGGEVQPSGPVYARTAWTGATRSMHSGHSLTDAYYGSPQGSNDGYLQAIRDSLLTPTTGSSGTYMFKNTFGGSSMEDRWDGNSLARSDIGDYDALMITEAGPPPHLGKTVGRTLGAIDTRWDRWLKFAANTVENGAAPEVILWSIWPYIDIETLGGWDGDDWLGVTFTNALEEYGQIYETMAAYGTAKMKALYPSLPNDWRVWLVPGHRFWLRIVADLATSSVPTISSLGDLFNDNIHPGGEAQYGLACLAYTCLYQVDLRTQTGVFVPGGIDSALRDYFWQIAWEIATAYEPIGMGGTEAEGSLWTEGVDADFMPDWTLAAADLTPGWSAIVPSGLNVDTNAVITGTLVENTVQSMSAPTWEDAAGAPVVPAQVEYVWRYDWSEIASETNTCTPPYGRAGQELAAWFRARVAGGPWTSWLDPSGGGTIVQAWQCEMTTSSHDAGGGNVLTGFNSGQGLPAFGSINREPIPGLTFLGLWRNELNSQLAIAFAGNQTATLTGMKVYIDANAATASWSYSASGNPFGIPVTMMVLSGQAAIPAATYSVRIAT